MCTHPVMEGNAQRAILVIHVDLHILVICQVLSHHSAVGTPVVRSGIQRRAHAVADVVPEVILGIGLNLSRIGNYYIMIQGDEGLEYTDLSVDTTSARWGTCNVTAPAHLVAVHFGGAFALGHCVIIVELSCIYSYYGSFLAPPPAESTQPGA